MIGALQTRGTIPVQRMCVSCAHFRPNVHSDAATPHHFAFVDAAFGDASLRLDCDDHVEADASARLESWARFTKERSEERRGGQEGVRTGRSGWARDHNKKKTIK